MSNCWKCGNFLPSTGCQFCRQTAALEDIAKETHRHNQQMEYQRENQLNNEINEIRHQARQRERDEYYLRKKLADESYVKIHLRKHIAHILTR